MGKVPEGVKTATIEGRDLTSAIQGAAEELGVKRHQIKHTIDMSHFRSASGTSVPRDTVKIIAWVNPDAPEEAPPEAEAAPRRERSDRGDRGDRGDRRSREEAPAGEETDASKFAVTWFEGVLEALGVDGKVSGSGTDDRVHVRIQPEAKAGRLIGRRGSTLAAVRHLLGLALEKYGEFTVDVDVDDSRDDRGGRGRDRDDRKSRGRDRGDRGDRDDRKGGRDKRRGGKGRGRDRDRGDRDGGGGSFPEDKLKALARRAAEKARDTGKTITINLELNSYDRRIVHMEVSEIDGVGTRSVEKGDKKVVQVIPD